MKIFLDTSDYEAVAVRAKTGLVDGVTTNPTTLSTVQNPREVIEKLSRLLPHGDISVEVTERDPEAVYAQALRIAQIAENIVVKIPCLPEYVSVINRLTDEEIALNITLVFTPLQGLMMARCGALYVSPFVARLDEHGGNGQELLEVLRDLFDTYGCETEILAASLRTVEQVLGAAQAGADVATIAPAVFDKLCEHPLSHQGNETFLKAWNEKARTTTF